MSPGPAGLRVAVLGNGYVGTVTAAALAWLGADVRGLESDVRKAEQLGSGQLGFYEPGLPALLREALGTGRLHFTDDAGAALDGAAVVIVCVGTPMRTDGAPDLSQVEEAAAAIGTYRTGPVVVVNKSTVPVGTAELVRTIVGRTSAPGTGPAAVVSNPEFLREGSAVDDFLHPDRIVIGGPIRAARLVLRLFRPIVEQTFDGGDPERRPDVFLTRARSAEMIKYAANAFLALKISFANEIADLCEATGAHAADVLPAVGADPRIGRAFLGAGLGWGGSCFPKDVAALVALAQARGLAAPVARAAIEVNQRRPGRIVERLREELGDLAGRRIAVLGLAFKPGTDDLRSAPSLEVIRLLREAGAEVVACDPVVKDAGDIEIVPDAYTAASGADACVLVTEWPEFRALDWDVVAERMRGVPVVDCRNALDAGELRRAGLTVLAMGRGSTRR